MNYFKAVNDKQLGVCLRMLYADGIQGTVEVVMNDKNKIEFHVKINADQETLEMLTVRDFDFIKSTSFQKVRGH